MSYRDAIANLCWPEHLQGQGAAVVKKAISSLVSSVGKPKISNLRCKQHFRIS